MYDEAELRGRCREYVAAFPGGVAYASKAFLCSAMARLVADEGLDIDVATGGELHLALARRRRSRDASCSTATTSRRPSSRRRCGSGSVGSSPTRSPSSTASRRSSRPGSPSPAVMVRVTPGVEAHTHEYLETAVDDSKFGFGLGHGAALAAVERIIALADVAVRGPALPHRLAGVPLRLVRPRARQDGRPRRAGRVGDWASRSRSSTWAAVSGSATCTTTTRRRSPSTASAVHAALGKAVAAHGLRSTPRLTTEPGRSIAAPAGLTLYRVGTIKEIPGVRTYVAVDGGMSDNLRPVTYGARYEAFVPARALAPRPATMTIAGKHCEQGDLLLRDAAAARRPRARATCSRCR